MTGFTLRPAVAADAAAIADIHVRGWQENYAGIFAAPIIAEQTFARRLAFWSALIADPAGRVDVAVRGTEVAGFGSRRPADAPLAALGFPAEIAALHIRAEAKRLGIGAALLARMAAAFAAEGETAMALTVLEANAPAVRFYEALGGIVAGRLAAPEDPAVFDLVMGWHDLASLAARVPLDEAPRPA